MAEMIDLLVVGQGLAGSLLSWRLLEAGFRIVVIADPAGAPTSRTAAGLVNPVTGQRLVKTAHVDILLPEAIALYRQLEQVFQLSLFHEKKMLRLFRTDKERQVYEKRCCDPAYQAYLGDLFESGQSGAGVVDPLGGFRQLRTGYLDTHALLDSLEDYFRQRGCLREARLDYAELQIDGGTVRWRDIEAGRVIFCEGYLGSENPWFNWLPFQPAKGEILTLQSEAPLPVEIINSEKWLLPTGGGKFKLGATYQWVPIDVEPTEEGKRVLLEALPQILATPPPVRLRHHGAGVRPATQDRMPFIGLHPQQPGLAIFNGFGSKGSLMIPWYANCLVRHLEKGEKLPPEADIARFSS
jgi:glycine oxidase